jgi:hypothetical protein
MGKQQDGGRLCADCCCIERKYKAKMRHAKKVTKSGLLDIAATIRCTPSARFGGSSPSLARMIPNYKIPKAQAGRKTRETGKQRQKMDKKSLKKSQSNQPNITRKRVFIQMHTVPPRALHIPVCSTHVL